MGRLCKFLLEVQSVQSLEEFLRCSLELLPKLLDCPYVTWNDFTPNYQLKGFRATGGYDSAIEGVYPEIVETVESHPLVMGYDLFKKPVTTEGLLSTSNVVSDRELRELPIYREAFRHVEADYQLFKNIYFRDTDHAGIAINSPRKFSQQQVLMAEIACDHLVVAYKRLLTIQAARTIGSSHFDRDARFDRLSARLKEAANYLLEGLPRKQVAAEMGVSLHTLNDYVKEIYAKLGVHSIGELSHFLFKKDRNSRGMR